MVAHDKPRSTPENVRTQPSDAAEGKQHATQTTMAMVSGRHRTTTRDRIVMPSQSKKTETQLNNPTVVNAKQSTRNRQRLRGTTSVAAQHKHQRRQQAQFTGMGPVRGSSNTVHQRDNGIHVI